MKRGAAGWKRFEKANRPPEGMWIWLTLEMMESPAWRALTHSARRVVDRIVIEHLKHGLQENGELIITFDDFENYGLDRGGIKPAIETAEALGFVALTERGQYGYGVARRANKFRLTWLPRKDGSPGTNQWKRYTSLSEAKAAIKKFPSGKTATQISGGSATVSV
jgi:hypothetical protein